MNNDAINKLSYGLFVLCAKDGEKDNGCIINTAMQVTDTPNQLCVCVNKSCYTHDMIMKTGEFTLSIINQDADFELFKHFGFGSGRDIDKFDTFSQYSRTLNGIAYITRGTNAYISIKIQKNVDLGTHTMFIGTVDEAEVLNDIPSATYEYYFQNIKPRPETPKSDKTVWVCKICGYEYEGEELPDDFICPLCKHPASDFEKIQKN